MLDIKIYLEKFKKDLWNCSRIIQDSINVLEMMKQDVSLMDVCRKISELMKAVDTRSNGLDFNIRDRDLKEFGNSFSVIPVKNLPKAIKLLNKEYKDAMRETDETEFIKKCANLHYDFLKTHPFSDGNGRISRLMLTIMLASHNILMPSLYTNYHEKNYFYRKDDAVRNGDYSEIQARLFDRIGHFIPLVLNRMEPQYMGTFEEIINQ